MRICISIGTLKDAAVEHETQVYERLVNLWRCFCEEGLEITLNHKINEKMNNDLGEGRDIRACTSTVPTKFSTAIPTLVAG